MNQTMGLLVYFLILCVAFLESSMGIRKFGISSHDTDTVFDVTKYGAEGDGKTDDTAAFEAAWKAACSQSSGSVKISVPSGREFLVSPVTFEGPCKSNSVIFEILGCIIAPTREDWKSHDVDQWLYFHEVDGLSVVGDEQGSIDGQGDSWWGQSDESTTPSALKFSSCKNLQISGLKHKNSQRNHVSITGCENAEISNLHMIAPAKSPNTDGIDISSSTDLNIHDCTMETGDDCIAVNGGTSNLNISRVTCGPGHGISIGSLGRNGNHDEVHGIYVDNCTFISTQNGVRIKTWQGGSGFARDISFKDIIFENASNPVVIDQYYCPHSHCDDKESGVQVSRVRYTGLRGTAASKDPTINFSCSETVPCTDIVIDDVDIEPAEPHEAMTARCVNAHGRARDTVPAVDCLLHD